MSKRKLTAAQRKRRKKFMTIFVNGKQKRVRRPQTIDGMSVDEFIARNADPIWLHQNELWHYFAENRAAEPGATDHPRSDSDSDTVPF